MIGQQARPPNLAETVDGGGGGASFREDVLAGLAKTPKSLPAKHLYDARGSRLFVRISNLDAYYLTRSEAWILENLGGAIGERLGAGAVLIEPGAGNAEKTEILLGHMERPGAVVPIEISESALEESSLRLARRFPDVGVHPIRRDFTRCERVPAVADGPRVVFFPGSTIGNFGHEERAGLWRRFARMAGEGGMALVGYDLLKRPGIILHAYNDSEGVSAAFNRNVLRRMNRELDGDFDLRAFEYSATWCRERLAVEMGQVSRRDQEVRVAGERFGFAEGEKLLIERSHKFSPVAMDAEAAEAGFEPVERWLDSRRWFCLALYRFGG